MAIDQSSATEPLESSPLPAIENEFPAYRAISTTAVLSLVFAVGSVFCYADLWFLLMAAGAIGFGLISLRNIRRLPEVLTGAGLAGVGIGIASLIAVTSVVRILSQDVWINIDAGGFAKQYVTVLRDEPVSVGLWYQQVPANRLKKNPDELVEELKKSRSPDSGDAYQEKSLPILRIKERLKGAGETIQYDSIETKAIDGLTTYANALIKLDGPGQPDGAEKQEYALFQMIKNPGAGRMDWIVQEIKYPYTPRSAVATVQKKADDGHGHGH